MTFRDILLAMLRRWYIPLVLIACAALITVVLARDGGVYTTTTVVSFMRPATTSLSPTNGTTDVSVIAFAGAVVQETNNGRPPARYSTNEAPLHGAGVRQGVLVELANSGNQWVSTFNRSDIEIEIVGRSAEWVESTQAELVNRILGSAASQQAALKTAAKDRITAAVVPLTMQIEHVTSSRRGQLAAGAAMLAVAGIVGGWGSVTADRLLAKGRAAHSARQPRVPDHAQEGTTA
ncbi:hypothetical protein QMG61_08195 [Cryobacterium sp. PH31-AA6]|uniref:hypothetical protein n=1 Tax=Cryobacterium sp. PH31-AA6 TaxID=3046205 RepID=UPI0024BB261B|nr:hypothetical protein [Cryobacterium sp. PH31-AA6]MDJ0323744.1 hypothetical protein [Cryobacterium sp. PH31-AA6]